MLYNTALTKRITMHDLVEEIGLSRDEYWGCRKLTQKQFIKILQIGTGDNFENYIVN